MMRPCDSNTNDYSNMPGYPFITKCPVCNNNKNIRWCHACDEGIGTIDNRGNIHCKKCNLDRFLMDLRYDCGNHYNNQYLAPNRQSAMYAMSQLAATRNLPNDVCEKICEKILEH